ncbi:hypothetical protein ACFLS1_12125, partial [Verrucomicrobiota bacterium]
VQNRFIYRVLERDIIRAVIRVHHVVCFEVVKKKDKEYYTFKDIKIRQDRKRFVFFCDPELRLRFKVTCIYLEVQDVETAGKTRIYEIASLFRFGGRRAR